MPERIQRRRIKGWQMPLNTLCVDRSTNWGNPYPSKGASPVEPALLVNLYRDWLKSDDRRAVTMRGRLHELRGKNLACWCPPGQPCHADVLLELANAPTSDSGHSIHKGEKP